VELEFLSHRAAERQLGSQEVRRRLAESIAEAVRKWLVRRK
jgi:N-acetylmuramoyl-L-alanine amidase